MTDGREPPRPGLRFGWIALALLAIGLLVSGALLLTGRANQPVAGRPTALPTLGGGTIAQKPSPTAATPSTFVPAPSGDAVNVAGVDETRTVECTDNAVSVSGVRNTVTLEGHCTRVAVSGVENTVTIDSADAIDVSGVRNRVTFRSGEPMLTQSGLENTLERG